MDEMREYAGRSLPDARWVMLGVFVKIPVFGFVPSDLERNSPGEVAVVWVSDRVTELIETHHRAPDASHVHALVGMRIARVGMEPPKVAAVGVFFAKRGTHTIPRVAVQDLQGVAALRGDAV